MKAIFRPSHGKPAFVLQPETEDDFGALKMFVEHTQHNPNDFHWLHNFVYQKGKVISAYIGFSTEKPIEEIPL